MRSDRRTPEQCQVLLQQYLTRHHSCVTPHKVNGIVPCEPIRDAIAIDREGRIIICLSDGSIVCYGDK